MKQLDNVRVILASASPRRKELMAQIGIIPEICPSHVEEIVTQTIPSLVVEELSAQKCKDVASGVQGNAIVLGADTVVASGDEILGKPSSFEDACHMLRMLSGKKHQVYTGVTLVKVENGECKAEDTFSVATDVYVCEMTEEEIHEYVQTGDPMDKAGAYGIQGFFARYVEKIDGDYNNVVGLPVSAVYQHIKKL